jgi:hypothetical protein
MPNDMALPVTTGYPDQAVRIQQHLRMMQRRYRERDIRWEEVRAIRRGDFDQWPDMVSDAFPRPIVANFIDTTARDLAEMLAPLPSFNCSSVSMRNDAERKRADMRTKIANNYVTNSRLNVQMLWGADHYWTYGMCVFYGEPDFVEQMPRIVVEEPTGGYPEFDRWGRLRSYTKRIFCDVHVLADLYPEYAQTIINAASELAGKESEIQLELIRFWDDWGQTLTLGGKHPFVLDRCRNRNTRIPVVVAVRPWLDAGEIKGQFDDVIWIQLARDSMAKLQFEAVEKAVTSPLALPNDVQDVSYGPDAVLKSATPEKIRKVGMEMTNMSFLESNTLLQDLQTGSRYPAVRQGTMDASVITGRGVQALQGGLDTQVRAAQTVFQNAFRDVAAVCFEMDEKIWPNTPKKVKGVADGTPFEIQYTPKKDISGNYSCDVEYGFAAGQDPNRATVMLLQLRAEKIFSRDYMARQVPFDIDITEEQAKVNVEDTRDALMQGIFAYVQSIPAMAQQGMDPAEAVQKISAIVKGLQKGDSVEDVVSKVFTPAPIPPEEDMASDQGVPGESGGGGAPGAAGGPAGGLTPSGLMTGVPAGQAGQAPGGRPDLSVMLAGLTSSGKPQMSNFLMKRRRV